MPPKKPPAFGPAQRLQREYERGIREITGRVLLSSKKQPEQTFDSWLNELAERSRKPDIQAASETLARRMITRIHIGNQRTWREAASRSQQSQRLHRLLEAEMQGPVGARVHQLVRENASLISSLSLEAATMLTGEVLKAQQSGARPGTVAKMARQRFPELLRSRTNLISRTETARSSTLLTQARCERLNLSWFAWESSVDQRTRLSHKNLHDVLCSWEDLPSPEQLVGEKSYGKYAPGSTFNCRCLVIPLLAFSDVEWPHRVYSKGGIRQMTLQDFKHIARLEDAA